MNIRIGYYGKDENVHSTFAKCINVIETAKYLETVADNWEDAKKYVHLILSLIHILTLPTKQPV